jgi:hypothetical protein
MMGGAATPATLVTSDVIMGIPVGSDALGNDATITTGFPSVLLAASVPASMRILAEECLAPVTDPSLVGVMRALEK